MQSVVAPSGVAEVLPEVVDGGDADLARKPVAHLFLDVGLYALDAPLYFFCVHYEKYLFLLPLFEIKAVYLQCPLLVQRPL